MTTNKKEISAFIEKAGTIRKELKNLFTFPNIQLSYCKGGAIWHKLLLMYIRQKKD